MHNLITHSLFAVAVAAELCGKGSLMPWRSNLQQCIQDVWALESICWHSELNLELYKSGFGFRFVTFTFDLALDGDLDACLEYVGNVHFVQPFSTTKGQNFYEEYFTY